MDPAGVAINSLFSECAECKELYAVGMYLLLVIVPITIFLYLYLRSGLTSHQVHFWGTLFFVRLSL